MPNLNSSRVKHRMAEAGIQSARQLSDVTGITYSTLRNAVAGCGFMNLANVYLVADAISRLGESPPDVVADILATDNEGVPDEPPKQPKAPPTPPKRTERTKGPRRVAEDAA